LIIKTYLHGDKDTMYDVGRKHGLKEETLALFMCALYEVAFDLDVDEKTGRALIVAVDGRKLEPACQS
jgi:hypothetical protein